MMSSLVSGVTPLFLTINFLGLVVAVCLTGWMSLLLPDPQYQNTEGCDGYGSMMITDVGSKSPQNRSFFTILCHYPESCHCRPTTPDKSNSGLLYSNILQTKLMLTG